jgi:hypothetical protein
LTTAEKMMTTQTTRYSQTTLPTTTTSASVSTRSAFNTQAAIPGNHITVTAGWDPDSGPANIEANDVRVTLNSGVVIGPVQIGSYGGTVRSRILIEAAVGAAVRPRVGQFRIGGGSAGDENFCTDIVIDSIDTNGHSRYSGGAEGVGGEDQQCFRGAAERVFIHNVRGIAAGYCFQIKVHHLCIANSNFFGGAVARADLNYAEGWNLRINAGPLSLIDSSFETTRYHVLRPHTYNEDRELLYVKNCDLINLSEGKIGWLGNRVETPAWGYWLGSIVEDSRIYVGSRAACVSGGFSIGQVLSLDTTTFSRIRNNTIYSGGTDNSLTFSSSNLTSERATAISNQNGDSLLVSAGRAPLPADAHSSDADLATNSFATLTGHPGYAGPGDPRDVPLATGYGFTLISGEGVCSAVWS